MNKNDTIRYNEIHKSSCNKYALDILRDIKVKLKTDDFESILKQSFEECTHFYLSMSPIEIYSETIKQI